MTDLLIVGGGAAGLMAAGAAGALGASVMVLEHNPKGPGQKLLITGKGRCNLTSDCDVRGFLPFVQRNPRFLYSSLTAFPPRAAMDLFASLGVPLKVERGGRVFPCSDRAADVRKALLRYAHRADFVEADADALLLRDGACVGAASGTRAYYAKAVLLATGGASYPDTGSDASGYRLARDAGHKITSLLPGLCALESDDPDCKRMAGLSLRNVRLTLLSDGESLYSEQGEVLFTHFGLSGPLTLTASNYVEDVRAHRYLCVLDTKPALSEKMLYDRLTREIATLGTKGAAALLEKLLPRSMRAPALDRWGIDPEIRAAQLTRSQKMALVQLCKNWRVPITQLGDLQHAVITRGGVDVRQINPKTMQSRLCRGLFFAGEILDVHAKTGGYNLQIAWSTAQAAAKAAVAAAQSGGK